MERKLTYKILFVIAVLGLAAYFSYPLDKRIALGLDLQGGMHLVLKVDTETLPPEIRKDATDRAKEIIENRINEFGVREPHIQKQGENEIVVQLPGITDRQHALDLIGRTALLEFKFVSLDPEKIEQAEAGDVPEGYELKYLARDERQPLLVKKETALTGDSLVDAQLDFKQTEFNEPVVSIKLNAEGAKKFAELTTNNVGKFLAIVLDGNVQSAPRINEPIPDGKAVIEGRFTVDEASDLALVLRSGALPAPMHVEEERTVGPLLGKDSIRKGVRATLIGAVLVLVFMAFYYLLYGLVANIALVLNLFLILGGLGMLPVLFPGVSATLTLPGIAGIALSLGMAVDANVLIAERIREELSLGRGLRLAVANGYDKAFSAILDANVTTLIAAFLLFQFGTGPIRGFAVTLTIGLIASLFTAIFVTRVILELLLRFDILKSLPMLKFIPNTNWDFIAKRKFFYLISAAVIITGLVVFFKKGKEAYGIDFSGGQIQQYSFKPPASVDEVRNILKDVGLADAIIQQIREEPDKLLIRTSEDKNTLITEKLEEKFPQHEIEVLKVEKVGPTAGKTLKNKALKAIIWSLIGILIYVASRFRHFNFAFAGVIALFHDVLIALGFLALTDRPIDLLSITAFLTIAGYSINDTIVIYDRVRENMRLHKKLSLYELINLSVNQTFGRTVLTSFATLLVVFAILFYGGEVLSNFAFALCVGFISGVYSTIYIASPLVLAWGSRSQARR
jgi:SecD/SecF fusion protein